MDFSEILKIGVQMFFKSSGFSSYSKEKALELSAELLQQIRRLLILVSITAVSLLLFLLGVHYIIIRLLDQLDRGEFLLTPSIIFLLVFIVACMSVVIYSTTRKTWIQTFDKDKNDKTQDSTLNRVDLAPIESAVSLYILDLVKEREWQRTQKEQKNEHANQSEAT